MQEMQLISCIRFSMQILIAESVFFMGVETEILLSAACDSGAFRIFLCGSQYF